MTDGPWERVSGVFHAVLARPKEEREQAIAELCAGDEALRHDVESLLAHLAGADAAGFGTAGSRPSAIAVGATLGPYQVREQIGAGGMGVVYRARDPRLGRDVAIKILPVDVAHDPDRLRRFQQEAESAAGLNHPNIVAVHDIGQHDGSPYIVSELLDGATLRERLNEARTPGLPVRKALDYAAQIARGLAAAHEKGIVHRDLKPENVFVTSDGHAKILDFGLAKLAEIDRLPGPIHTGPTRPSDTKPGIVMGTAGYMAPEQVRGQTADARADIFAFGATLYEMLTGRRAFRGETAMDTLSAILTEEPAPLSSNDGRVPPALALIVHRCLEKTPSARFQTATDLAFALEALSGSNPALSAANVAGDTWWRRRGTWWVGGAALAAGALLGIGIESVPRTPTGTSASGPSSTGPEEPRPTSAPSEPMRGIVILRPPFAQITNGGRQVIAISPDGKSIVFVANRRLWLKRWDQDESEPIEGTESGSLSTPFFSPDGQRLGFFQGGVLNTIPLSGGEPQAVFEAGSPWGASWGDDDQIVYATLEGVFRVPAAGGTPKALVTVTRPESVYGPQMLPDGDHLLMTVSNAGAGRWDDARIVVQALSTGTRKVLPLKGRDARYLASGHLVYVVDRTLYAVAFDAKSIEVHGTPVAMERELTGGAYGAAHYAVSKAGHLVYVPRTEAPTGSPIALVDLSGHATPLPYRLRHSMPRFSPDGTAFVAFDDEDGLSVFPTSGSGTVRQLLPRPEKRRGLSPALWSGDGRITIRIGDQMVRMAGDGTGAVEELTTNGNQPFGWSPDGETLYSGGRRVFKWHRGSEAPVELSVLEGTKGGANLSLDGQWLALWRMDADGTNVSYIEDVTEPKRRFDIGKGHHPLWHPDSRHLFYVDNSTSGRLMMVEVRTSPSVEVGKTRAITDGVVQETNNQRNYDVRPDGKMLVVELLQDRFDPNGRQMRLVLNWIEAVKRQLAPK